MFLLKKFFFSTCFFLFFLIFLFFISFKSQSNLESSIYLLGDRSQLFFASFSSFFKKIFSFDFGYSLVSHKLISFELILNFFASLELVTYIILLATPSGMFFGMFLSFNQQKIFSKFILKTLSLLKTIPIFLLSSLFIFLFSFSWFNLPYSGRLSLEYQVIPVSGVFIVDLFLYHFENKELVFDAFKHLILPVTTGLIIPFILVTNISYELCNKLNKQRFFKLLRQNKSRSFNGLGFFIKSLASELFSKIKKKIHIIFSLVMVLEFIFSYFGLGSFFILHLQEKDINATLAAIIFISFAIIIIDIFLFWLCQKKA